MNRRGFLRSTGATIALAAADPALAAPRRHLGASVSADGLPRIGVLGDSNPLAWVFRSAEFRLECRWADESGRRLSDLAAELVALDVDCLVAAGARATRAAAGVTRTVPIVFVMGGEPVEAGLVARLTAPGRNLTGLSLLSDAQLSARRLSLLREAVPQLARLGVLSNPDNALHEAALVETRRAADGYGIDVCVAGARMASRLEGAFMAMNAAGVDASIVLPDAMFSIHAGDLVDMARASCLPCIYPARSFADAGGLMALHGNSAEVIRRVAALVGEVLGGTSPATLPVQRLDSLELTINLEAAVKQDLELPPALLARADALLRH